MFFTRVSWTWTWSSRCGPELFLGMFPARASCSSLYECTQHAITQRRFVNRHKQSSPRASGEPRECPAPLRGRPVLETMASKRIPSPLRPSVYTCSAGSVGPHLAADLRRRTNKQEGRGRLDEGHTHNSPSAECFTDGRE